LHNSVAQLPEIAGNRSGVVADAGDEAGAGKKDSGHGRSAAIRVHELVVEQRKFFGGRGQSRFKGTVSAWWARRRAAGQPARTLNRRLYGSGSAPCRRSRR